MVVIEIVVCVNIFTTCLGLLANLAFAYKLCTNRVPRNPLLMGMMISDLSVCAVVCPVKTYRCLYWPTLSSLTSAVFLDFFEGLPVSCATLSMMCLAVDRYCVVKKFQPFNRKITREKTLPYIVGFTWIIASFVVLLEAISCHKEFSWFSVAVIIKVVVVNAIPILTVLISHLYLYSNLTAVSLTARARHGELPLPMPIIQSKKPLAHKSHVIIVAGMSKHDEMDATENVTAAESTVPSSLKNRKRLGYFMLLMALCFFFLWIPYTTCEVLNIIWDNGMSPELLELTQCLGLLHSGLSPFLSIASMDRDWNKGTFAACRGLDILQEHKSPSSTNEDALGPFNPRLVRPNKKANYNRRSSSENPTLTGKTYRKNTRWLLTKF